MSRPYTVWTHVDGHAPKSRYFATFPEAETYARRKVGAVPSLSGCVTIDYKFEEIATIRTDALDRVWTDLRDVPELVGVCGV